MDADAIKSLFEKHVVPSYGRFDVVLTRGEGSYVWDTRGKRHLDCATGIAVCALGHAHPEMTRALAEQAATLVHVSNLYYYEGQGLLARRLAGLIGPGKLFFCNSGAEANEALYKLARRFGHDDGRFEIITAFNSFHGRTLAGIAATGQDKIKKGFGPAVPGFTHVPFNDLDAVGNAVSPATAAVLVEVIQGEGGIVITDPEYLLGLRRLCDERNLLLLIDAVQCGHFRTGRYMSYQRILENHPGGEAFLPDAIAMAKSLGGGYPMGGTWIRQPYAGLLNPGSHGTTYGGSPLACAVALKILDVIERDHLADNAREIGEHLKSGLQKIAQQHPQIITSVRGLGLLIGFELARDIPALKHPAKTAAAQFVVRLSDAGLLTPPAGQQVVRLLPPLNLSRTEADEALEIIQSVAATLAAEIPKA